METDLVCQKCGHELSVFRVSEPDRGERMASRIADRVATWWFPTAILVGVLGWLAFNAIAQPFEPYPIIVLACISAVLATTAACQGPLILLVQRRSAIHDRERDNEVFRVATNTEADIHDLRAAVERIAERLDQTSM